MSTQTLFSITSGASALSRATRTTKAAPCKDTPATSPDATTRTGDSVELSAGAALNAATNSIAATPARQSGVRSELVNRIKLQIDSGTYDVDAKLDKVADGILRDLNLQG